MKTLSTRVALVAALLCRVVPALSAEAPAPALDHPAFSDGRPLRVVATVFPAWDWAREVIGPEVSGVELSPPLDNGVDLHSYQPTAEDLKTFAGSDLLIHVGGESDGWVAAALAATPNPRRKVLSLVEVLGDAAKVGNPAECVECERRRDGHHDGHGGPGHRHDGDAEVDEHVWLSLRHARTFVMAIADSLAALDPSRAEIWRANAVAYAEKLEALDREYAAVVAAASRKTLVVADRFPLRYLADDYGLRCFAAFPGCSAETEASFKTVVLLAGKVDESGAKSILVLEGSKHRMAETVRAATRTKDQAIVVFDSLQSTPASRAAAGETYLGVMRRNLAALAEALK